jgi:hypothetical protein
MSRAEAAAAETKGSQALTDTVVQAHAIGVAWQGQLLGAIRELDEARVWETDGAPSLERWLTAHLFVSWRTAVEWAGWPGRAGELTLTPPGWRTP